jgi:hypothetical protein
VWFFFLAMPNAKTRGEGGTASRGERRFWLRRVAGGGIMVSLMLAVVLGAFGEAGPLSRAVAWSGDRELELHYQRFIHARAPARFEVVLHKKQALASTATTHLFINQALFKQATMDHLSPEPRATVQVGEYVGYEFLTAGTAPLVVTFQVTPAQPGRLPMIFLTSDRETIQTSAFVYP